MIDVDKFTSITQRPVTTFPRIRFASFELQGTDLTERVLSLISVHEKYRDRLSLIKIYRLM